MSLRTTVTTSKFVGTISLGLLTGLSYTLSTATTPALLSLPTYKDASKTFAHLRQIATSQSALLSSISASAFLLAYTLSPPKNRHPYLIYAIISISAGWAREGWATLAAVGSGVKQGVQGEGAHGGRLQGNGTGADSSGEDDWEVEGARSGEGLNGEVVRDGMEKWRGRMVGRTVVWGVGWALAMVGIWGDAYA